MNVFSVLAMTWALGVSPADPFNIALSARVVTSDPSRLEGTRAGRLDDFPAEDAFLTRDIPADEGGAYTVPVWKDGTGCIGLEWAERRILSEVWLSLDSRSAGIEKDLVVVQYWSSQGRQDGWSDIGQTQWQGKWEPLPGKVERSEGRLRLRMSPQDLPEFKDGSGILRIRWLFPTSQTPLVVKELGAQSPSQWATDSFRIEAEGTTAGQKAAIAAYNGSTDQTQWDASQPLALQVRYCIPGKVKADRTSLRFVLPSGAFAIGIDDVLTGDGVYVKDYGVFVARASTGMTLAGYRAKTAGSKTILQRVREMPDQTFAQAMKAVWRPIQNNGPTLVSLAADNRKFIVQRTGEVLFKTDKPHFTITPQFGQQRTRLDRIDWGTIGVDTAVTPPDGRPPLALRIKDKSYSKGIGLHANASFMIRLGGRFDAFDAEVGVQQQGSNIGNVTFQVLVDGKKKFDSGPMQQTDPAVSVHVPLSGAKEMVLKTLASKSIENAAGDWAEARLIGKDGKPEYIGDIYQADRAIIMSLTRHLDGDWLPIPVSTVEKNGVRYSERVFVAPLDDAKAQSSFACRRPLCVVEYTAENTQDESRPVALEVNAAPKVGTAQWRQEGSRLLLVSADRLWASVDFQARGGLEASSEPEVLKLSGVLPAKARSQCVVYLPGWEAAVGEEGSWPSAEKLRSDVESYWTRMLAPAMQVEIPEPLLNNFIRSTQIQCLMAARNRDSGKLFEPWIAGDTYGPFDSEAQAVVFGMDLFGHHEFARRANEFFISQYKPSGLMTVGYTVMGTGQHLWTLAAHCLLTHDDEWLRQFSPKILTCCDWVLRQLTKTRQPGVAGKKPPEFGLAPPGVIADWNRYAYYFYVNAHYCTGLRDMAVALARINHPRAAELARAAEEYRQDLSRAYRWNQARMPVVPLRDGTWIPPTPSSLYTFGLTRDFFNGVSATAHDTEAGGNHLVSFGLIDAASREAAWTIDYMEDRWFLIDGIFGGYPAAENERDWFNLGGFAKLQPHYTRANNLHACRDDVKPFIRTYFNLFFPLLNRENLTYWEHLNNGGAWNKTHESAWFLEMTRNMLVLERGNELWLAPFVTCNWLKTGMTVSVRNAPTRFGPVSYELKRVGDAVEATIQPPTDSALSRIVLRVRDAEGRAMRNALVNGQVLAPADIKADTVAIPASHDALKVRIEY